jgi:ATP-dependent HslUV protease ATP-binding subunit HslU
MVIHLPGAAPAEKAAAAAPPSGALTPRQIVTELDRYIIGQAAAKRAVAVALRNRTRRRNLPADLAEEVAPKNIILIGPTGVGKTEIARRLARLAGAPFLKVEATRYTEVGYVGRDVESMVRDLVELAIEMVREEKLAGVRGRAAAAAEERLLAALLPAAGAPAAAETGEEASEGTRQSRQRTREKLRRQLGEGALEEAQVEVDLQGGSSGAASLRFLGAVGMGDLEAGLKDMLPGLLGAGRPRRRRTTVREARPLLEREEEERLLDSEEVTREAVRRAEQDGIIFVDELDKIAGRESGRGPDVSREGVQRDLLPIIEGTTVHTRHGLVRTDHILFIASGAFHVSKPSDLIPELQGRFPIRVELDPLGKDDFVRILTEPRHALLRQYTALLRTEGVNLEFTPGAVEAIAACAQQVNDGTENIGARRLHTVMERLLEEISFEAPELAGQTRTIDVDYVQRMLASIAQDHDLSKYIL